MKIKFSKEQAEFIKGFGSCVNDDWYHLPFWWKDCGDNVFEQVRFENLPKEVIDTIVGHRNEDKTTTQY